MSEQQAKEAGPDKACCEPAKQSAAEEARPSRRLPDCAGLARLCHASLDRRGGIRRRARNRRRGESPHAPASARGPTARTGIGITRTSAAAIAAAAIRKRRRNIALSPPETWRA